MSESLQCYRCGAGLAALSLPLARLDECPQCRVELHVCRMCRFFDPGIARQCREDDAEEVKEKFRANFCDYFKPNPDAHDPAYVSADARARSAADTLFGGDDGNSRNDDGDAGQSSADDLFR